MTTGKRYDGFDYQFRPTSYWRVEDDLLAELLKNVTGSSRRRMIRDYFLHGRIDDLDPRIRAEVLSEERRTAFGQIHPSFMGGEYLPDYRAAEVEIARIELQSTSSDVLSIRARRGVKATARIRYRLLDEYGTGFVWRPKSSKLPLTFAELVDLIDGASPGEDFDWAGGLGLCYNEMNFAGIPDAADLRHFTTVSSEFYPQLEAHYDRLHQEWVAEKTPDEPEEDEVEAAAADDPL